MEKYKREVSKRMSSKIKIQRYTTERLKVGIPVTSELKTVAEWNGRSLTDFLAYCKASEIAITVGVHKTDDVIVCAQLAQIPGQSAYSGEMTEAQRNELLSNTTTANIIWMYTHPDYRNQGYFTEMGVGQRAWMQSNFTNYRQTIASRIDTTQPGAAYIKSHLSNMGYSTPVEEDTGSTLEKATHNVTE